jgi:hypothetical protein
MFQGSDDQPQSKVFDLFLIKADLYQIGGYPVRYSETRHAEVAKRTFRFGKNAGVTGRFVKRQRNKTVEFPQ